MIEIVNVVGVVMGILIFMLVFIVVIFLFVGGVGIMNIMFVFVIEWIWEIGICMVVGVRFWDIFC